MGTKRFASSFSIVLSLKLVAKFKYEWGVVNSNLKKAHRGVQGKSSWWCKPVSWRTFLTLVIVKTVVDDLKERMFLVYLY